MWSTLILPANSGQSYCGDLVRNTNIFQLIHIPHYYYDVIHTKQRPEGGSNRQARIPLSRHTYFRKSSLMSAILLQRLCFIKQFIPSVWQQESFLSSVRLVASTICTLHINLDIIYIQYMIYIIYINLSASYLPQHLTVGSSI